MKIDRNNFEAFFLDFVEGNLDANQLATFNAFLLNNPDLKEELDAFENLAIEPEQVAMPNPSALKKEFVATTNISAENYEEQLVAELEGDLSDKEQEELLLFLEQNKLITVERELFQKTKLTADTAIVFADKAALKKKAVVVLFPTPLKRALAAAASITLLIIFWFLYQNNAVEGTAIYSPRKSEQKIIKNYTPDYNYKIKTIAENAPISKKDKTVKRGWKRKENKKVQESPTPKEQPIIKKLPENLAFEKDTTKKEIELKNNLAEVKQEEKKKEDEKSNEVEDEFLELAQTSSEDDYLTIGQWIGSLFKRKVLSEEEAKNTKVDAVDIAKAGTKGINKILGTNWEIEKQYDEKDDLTAFSLNAGKIGFVRQVKQKN